MNGTPLPGFPRGFQYDHFEFIEPDNAGGLAYSAIIIGPGVNSSNNTGLWHWQNGGSTLIARTGEEPPGLERVVFEGFTNGNAVMNLDVNSAGEVVFAARLAGGGCQHFQ